MRFEDIQFLQVRAAVNNPSTRFEKEGHQFRQPTTEVVTDAEGVLVRKRQSLTLIEKLMVRAGAMPAPAPRRGRGRPRKGGAA